MPFSEICIANLGSQLAGAPVGRWPISPCWHTNMKANFNVPKGFDGPIKPFGMLSHTCFFLKSPSQIWVVSYPEVQWGERASQMAYSTSISKKLIFLKLLVEHNPYIELRLRNYWWSIILTSDWDFRNIPLSMSALCDIPKQSQPKFGVVGAWVRMWHFGELAHEWEGDIFKYSWSILKDSRMRYCFSDVIYWHTLMVFTVSKNGR